MSSAGGDSYESDEQASATPEALFLLS